MMSMKKAWLLIGISFLISITSYSNTILHAENGNYGPVSFTDRGNLPEGWAHSGLGSNYADSSIKFDSTNDSLYNISNVVFNENTPSSINVTLKLRGNSLSGAYSFGVYGLTSLSPKTRQSDSLVTISSISGDAGGTNYDFNLSNISSNNKIVGIEIVYIAKASGNVGLYSVEVNYNYALDKTLSTISSSGTPSKTTYYVGESFSLTGLTINANYSDASSSDVTNSPNLTITPSTFSSTETTSVEITYTEGGITSDPIVISGLTVLNKVLNSISINNASTHQTTFVFQEAFTSDGLIINANYNSGLEEVTSGFTVTGVSTSVLGNQTATVTLDGQTTTYSISVSNIGAGFGSDLIFSEYVEGSGNNKYIEIFNPTSSSIDLSGFSLRLFINGSSTASNDIALSGSLASLSTKVYKNSSAGLSLPSGVTADNNAAVNFNGNDALGLWKAETSTYVDIFGKIGFDPGTAWTSNGVSTENKTLRRKSTVLNGVSTSPETFDPSLEWEQFDIDTASGLGTHSINSVNATTQAEAYRDFLEDYETCTVYTNEQVTTLVNEYVAMVNEAKTTFASLTLEDYSSTDYANNGNSYSGLTKTETVNALAKLDAIIALYNAANPGNTVSRNVMNLSGSITKPNEVIDHSFQSLIMFMLISFSGVLILKKKIQPY